MQIRTWKIGSVVIPNQIVLAPMAGITDKTFRIIAREHGCGLTITEMISAKALTYKNIRTKALLDIDGEERPIGIQLFGGEPDIMAEAARVAEAEGASFIDINMGCPVPKVVRNAEGSALLEQPELAGEIVRAMVRAVKIPVTVKMRLGLTKDRIVAAEFAKRMEEAGTQAISVHGRTRDQYYSGKADWESIKKVKETVVIPVIGNGDIWRPADTAKMLAETGCDAVMIGRGALGNPWLISRTCDFLRGIETPPPTAAEKIHGALRHLDMMIAHKGEMSGVREMRKHLAWYLKGLPRTAASKDAIFRAKTGDEVRDILHAYLAIL